MPSLIFAGVAQLVEQLIRNQQVAGSSPTTSSTKNLGTMRVPRFFCLGEKSHSTEFLTYFWFTDGGGMLTDEVSEVHLSGKNNFLEDFTFEILTILQ